MYKGICSKMLLIALLCGNGCSDDDTKVTTDGGTKNDGSSSLVTRANGGTASTADGKASLTVPAASVEKDVNISITPQTNYPADTRVVKGTVFDFNPSGTTFSKPATMTIAYAVANMPAGAQEDSLAIYKVVGTAWELMANSEVDLAKKTVTTSVSSFSTYGILASTIAADAGVEQPADSGVPDTTVDSTQLDGSVIDSTKTDGPILDTAVVDTAAIDTAAVDIAVTDTALPDTLVIDTAIIDVLTVDTMVTDSSVAACNTVVNNAPLITRVKTDDPPPTLTGGTVVDGTYYLTEERYYDSGASDNYIKETLVLSNSGTVGEIVLLQAKTNPPPGPEYHVNASYTFTGGANVTLAYTCGTSGNVNTTYQATTTTFTIRVGPTDRTYTKQ